MWREEHNPKRKVTTKETENLSFVPQCATRMLIIRGPGGAEVGAGEATGEAEGRERAWGRGADRATQHDCFPVFLQDGEPGANVQGGTLHQRPEYARLE